MRNADANAVRSGCSTDGESSARRGLLLGTYGGVDKTPAIFIQKHTGTIGTSDHVSVNAFVVFDDGKLAVGKRVRLGASDALRFSAR
jgi:hypothetical protein